MAYDRYLIAPLNSGLQTDLLPWQIQEDSWATLYNAYVWRGRLRKRFGSKFMGSPATVAQGPFYSRLRTSYDNAGAAMATSNVGNITAIVPGATGYLGQQFSIGDYSYTIIDGTAGAHNMLTNDPAATIYTFNPTNGQVVINGATGHLTSVYFYPANPVMGISQYLNNTINNQTSIAFDTQFAYQWSNGWQRIGYAAGTTWHGTDSQFFWTTNYRGINSDNVYLFVTNFNASIGAVGANDDPMYYWDGVAATFTNFTNSTTFLTTGERVASAKIIIPFHQRLLLLNTIESNAAHNSNTAHPQRCRFSWNGSPVSANAWLEPNQTGAGGAGYIDAATKQAIVSAEFVRDRLIVYFERSTWEIVYTGNEILPFIWQKINTELGAESTFSRVPFDKVILGMGSTGVHACNGANVERIDSKIPTTIYQIQNKNNGVLRCAGIRDYYTEMVYWTYPSIDGAGAYPAQQGVGVYPTYPNKVLVYNYNTGNWALNTDCITVFGYFDQQMDATWANCNLTWAQNTATWSSGTQQSNFRQVIGGNQQGFTFIVNADITKNERVMQITQLTPVTVPSAVPVDITATVINHTVRAQEYLQISDPAGTTGLDQVIVQVKNIIDQNNFVFNAPVILANYTGGGYFSRVSRIFAQSKQWNPYQKSGRNFCINKIDFAVKKTSNGQITVDYSPSSTSLSMIGEAQVTNSILGNGILETCPYGALYGLDPIYPLESEQTTLWHPIYFDSDGEFIQITLTLSDDQMRNIFYVFEDFWLEGLVLNTQPTSTRLQ